MRQHCRFCPLLLAVQRNQCGLLNWQVDVFVRCFASRKVRVHDVYESSADVSPLYYLRVTPLNPIIRNAAGDGSPKEVLSAKLQQFFPLADASALSTESLTKAFGAGGKEGLLKHCLDQAVAASEKKVWFLRVLDDFCCFDCATTLDAAATSRTRFSLALPQRLIGVFDGFVPPSCLVVTAFATPVSM